MAALRTPFGAHQPPQTQLLSEKTMRSSRLALMTASVCFGLLAGCGGGGGDNTTGPTNGGNPGGTTGGTTGTTQMIATIDGKAWTASSGGVMAFQVSSASGGYLISGLELTGTAIGTSLSISINDIPGPGTYPLGTDGVSVAGGFAGVTVGATQTWTTPVSGAAGTITITALTTAHIAGTFSYTASLPTNGATGARVVTSGVFDAPFKPAAVIKALPDSVGSKMSATLNGQAWNAGIVGGQTGSGFISISGINDKQTILFTIPIPAAAGTYVLNNVLPNFVYAWDPNATKPAGARCCWGVQGDVGTVTFTTLTKTRAKGTFSATLSPQPGTAATGQLTIANGTFDIGLFHNP
jgi:hypothetical protein